MTGDSQATKGLVERAFDTARELVDALDVSNDEWSSGRGPSCPWIFRGQARAEWSLVPPAWRAQQSEPTAPIGRMMAALAPFAKPSDPMRDAPREREVFAHAMAEIALVSAFV